MVTLSSGTPTASTPSVSSSRYTHRFHPFIFLLPIHPTLPSLHFPPLNHLLNISSAYSADVLIRETYCGKVERRGDAVAGNNVTFCFTTGKTHIIKPSFKWQGKHEDKSWSDLPNATYLTWSERSDSGRNCIQLLNVQPSEYIRLWIQFYMGTDRDCGLRFKYSIKGKSPQ